MTSQSKSVLLNGGHSRYHEPDAKYPAYISVSKRHESFVDWPVRNVLQSAKNMVLAGFYYIGSADRSRCFYCGLTLRDWDEDDDPFVVHKQWAPKCGYIAQISDQQLSSGIRSLHVTENDHHGSSITVTNTGVLMSTDTFTDGASTLLDQEQIHTDAISSTAVSGVRTEIVNGTRGAETMPSRVWDHPPHVQAVLEMGYTLEDVSRAIDSRRHVGGEEFTDASSLLRAVEGWE